MKNPKKPYQEHLPPYCSVLLVRAIRNVLSWLHRRMFPASVVLYELFQHFYLLPPLYVAAELDLATLMAKGPKKLDDLARQTGTNADALYRVLRALASYGIFKETSGKVFRLTPLTKPLLTGKGSIRHMILQHLGSENWLALGNLMHTVKTGVNAFEHVHGLPIYQYLDEHPDHYAVFERSMADLSDLGISPVLQRYSFHSFQTIADIGGGEGSLLCGILKRNPSARGIIFDVSSALSKTNDKIISSRLTERMKVIPGDFFQSVPVIADAYLLKNILHNWDDTSCLIILRNLRMVMGSHAKLIIIEMILPPDNAFSTAKLIDIQMLATMPGGRERTLEEYRSLLHTAGLRLLRTVDTIAPISIMEAGH